MNGENKKKGGTSSDKAKKVEEFGMSDESLSSTAMIEGYIEESMVCKIEAEEQVPPNSSIQSKPKLTTAKSHKVPPISIPEQKQRHIQVKHCVTKRCGIEIQPSRICNHPYALMNITRRSYQNRRRWGHSIEVIIKKIYCKIRGNIKDTSATGLTWCGITRASALLL